jgi:PAS domain S-box-containing protein
MKVPFFIKIFIAFLLFASILLGFSAYIFQSFYANDFQKKQFEQIEQTLNNKQHYLKQYLNTLNEQLLNIGHTQTLQNYMNRGHGQEALIELLKLLMKNNTMILQAKYITLNSKERLKLFYKNNMLVQAQEDELQSIRTHSCFKHIVALQQGEIWNSYFEPQLFKGEVLNAKQNVLKVVLRVEHGFLTLVVDANTLMQTMQDMDSKNSYIIDNKGYFIIHQNQAYNWSQYLFSNKTIHSMYEKSREILEQKSMQTTDFISKKVYINDQDFIILLTQIDKKAYEKYFKNFKSYLWTIFIIGLVIAIFLALIFSEPLSKIYQKAQKINENLDQSIKKNSEELSESLKIIDRHVMSIRMDKNAMITDVSTAFCDFSGYSKEELLGHHHKILMHPDLSSEEYEHMWNDIYAGQCMMVELKGIKKDGGFYWVESHIEPLYEHDGEIVGFNAIRNNITDKKIIENLYSDINYQVQQYNAIFQNAHSGIGLVDLKGNFKKVNFMFSKLLGYSSSELLTMNCFNIVDNHAVNFLRKVFVEAIEIGSISNIEKIFIHKDSSLIHLEMSLNLLPDKNHFVLVVNSLQDKRKLQELNQNLELKIKQEVEKSRQKDRIHQQEQIENVKLKSIGSLAAGITHEINTPLTYIKGNFEMMQYDIEDLPQSATKEQMLEDAKRINDGLNRIANIVESMREISQSSNETKEKVNIYSTIITALTMTFNRSKQVSRIYINQKLFNIEEINKHEEEFFCTVQKQRVEQVWIVIINNALDELSQIEDYEQRVLNITINKEKNDIVIQFKDNAGGIKQENIDTIFDAFVSTKEYNGIGVGLNISKKIIEQQNGKIRAFNENNGAVFEVRLQQCE